MTPKEEALASCDQAIKRSQQNAKVFRTLDRSFQAAIVFLGGLTPVLALWTTLPTPLQVLPSALAGAFAGILAIFRWRDDYLRLSLTAFLYESERLKFTTRTTDLYKSELDEEQALSNFVTRLAIIGTEDKAAYLAEWRQTSATRVTAPGNQHER